MKFNRFITVLCLTAAIFMGQHAFSNDFIKEPNVSGQFYEASPVKLASDVNDYISTANIVKADEAVDMIIVPHAGYFFSGAVAGFGFKAIARKNYRTVIILAPSHFHGFDGISVWPKGAFRTPLGDAPVDEDFAGKLISAHEKFYYEPAAFQKEHSLEVEIPFLQESLEDFKIVPVVMGQPDPDILNKFALALKDTIGAREDVLIIVSTDLSHYHDDKTAREMDRRAIEAIVSLNPQRVWEEGAKKKIEMCGFIPVMTALLYAKHQGLNQAELLKYANSADASGDKTRVVGYSAIKIFRDKNTADRKLSNEQKKALFDIAREAVAQFVKNNKTMEPAVNDARLKQVQGAFVTLNKDGHLRGCIGNIIGQKPLYLTVRDMAIAAASQDPRFQPVEAGELKDIDVEVSVLSVPRKANSVDEIQMGVHGVIVSQGPYNHGIFLPQVATETGWSREEFMSQLCAQKAGLPADCWQDPKTRIEIFTAEVFGEKDF